MKQDNVKYTRRIETHNTVVGYQDKTTVVSGEPSFGFNPYTIGCGTEKHNAKHVAKTVITGRRVTRKGIVTSKPIEAPKKTVKTVKKTKAPQPTTNYKQLAMKRWGLDLSTFSKAQQEQMYKMREAM